MERLTSTRLDDQGPDGLQSIDVAPDHQDTGERSEPKPEPLSFIDHAKIAAARDRQATLEQQKAFEALIEALAGAEGYDT